MTEATEHQKTRARNPAEPVALRYGVWEEPRDAWRMARWIGVAWSLGVLACCIGDTGPAVMELAAGGRPVAEQLAWLHALLLPASAATLLAVLISRGGRHGDRWINRLVIVTAALFVLWPVSQMMRGWYFATFPTGIIRTWSQGNATTYHLLLELWRSMWQISQWIALAMLAWATLAPASVTPRRLVQLAIFVILLHPALYLLRIAEGTIESPSLMLKHMFTVGSLIGYLPALATVLAAFLAISALRAEPTNILRLRLAALAFGATLAFVTFQQWPGGQGRSALELAEVLRNAAIFATPALALMLYPRRI